MENYIHNGVSYRTYSDANRAQQRDMTEYMHSMNRQSNIGKGGVGIGGTFLVFLIVGFIEAPEITGYICAALLGLACIIGGGAYCNKYDKRKQRSHTRLLSVKDGQAGYGAVSPMDNRSYSP